MGAGLGRGKRVARDEKVDRLRGEPGNRAPGRGVGHRRVRASNARADPRWSTAAPGPGALAVEVEKVRLKRCQTTFFVGVTGR